MKITIDISMEELAQLFSAPEKNSQSDATTHGLKDILFETRGYSLKDIIFETRGEAEDILCRMEDLIACCGKARVSDMYALASEMVSYTDCLYGWTDLRNTQVVRSSEGYKIMFPKPVRID